MPKSIIAQDGGYPGAFLRIGAGARSLGLGGAFVAIANDASTCYWNPAGLTHVNKTQFLFSHSMLSLDREYNFSSVVFCPSPNIGIGISWIKYAVGKIEQRNTSGQLLGDFSSTQNAYIISYGFRAGKIFSFGTNTKLISHDMLNYSSLGFGLDFGILFTPWKFISFGGSLQNIETNLNWNTESLQPLPSEKIPLSLRAGIALHLPLLPIILCYDYEKNEKQKARNHFGAELDLGSLIIRGGSDNKNLTLSAGIPLNLSFAEMQLDYGFCNEPYFESSVHRFTVLLSFAKKKNDISLEKDKIFDDELIDMFSYMETRVLLTQGNKIAIGLGSLSGLKKGTICEIYRENNIIEEFIGKYLVYNVREDVAAMKLIFREKKFLLKKGDKIKVKVLQ